MVDSPRRFERPREVTTSIGSFQQSAISRQPAIRASEKGDYQMATERLKFRCYRCNQLLAVVPSKAGTIVACPKCQADLLIPAAEAGPRRSGENQGKGEVERPRQGRVQGRISGPGLKRPPSWARALGCRCRAGPHFSRELAGAIPPDLADLRPEDLRVEAEFFENLNWRTFATSRRRAGSLAGSGVARLLLLIRAALSYGSLPA